MLLGLVFSRLTIHAIAVVLVSSALAYNEPDNFAGIKFGQDIRQQLEPCPTTQRIDGQWYPNYGDIARLGKPCQHGFDFSRKRDESDVRYVLFNIGEIQK